MPDGRHALVVATYEYADGDLRRLTAPRHDAEAFADVLRDPEIAGFDVTTLVNQPNHVVGRAIADFYACRRRDDLALLYFSGHGLKDDEGRLYLAMADTSRAALRFTGLSAAALNEEMDASRSRRKVLILDCCYGGAFPAGRTPKADPEVHALTELKGRGRVVLTASDATQYAFEGDELRGSGRSSVFTRHMVEGIRTGAADEDADGYISLDELYTYVYERVVAETPQQRPKKQQDVDGQVLLAVNAHWTLPPDLRHLIDNQISEARRISVDRLVRLHRGGSARVRAVTLHELARLAEDDSRAVSSAATAALREVRADAGTPVPPDPPQDWAEQARIRPETRAGERGRQEAAERAGIAQAVWEAEQVAARERARLEAAARQEADRLRREADARTRQQQEQREAERRETLEREEAERRAAQRDAVQREAAQREAAERQAARRRSAESESATRTRPQAEQQAAPGSTRRGVLVPALLVAGLAVVLFSATRDFESVYADSASDWGWTPVPVALGICLPLAGAAVLLVAPVADRWAVPLASGLALGAALCLTHLVSRQGAAWFVFADAYTAGQGYWLLVLAWPLVVSAAAVLLRHDPGGPRPSAPSVLRRVCVVVGVGCVIAGLSVADEADAGFEQAGSLIDFVLLGVVALPMTSLRLSVGRRVAGLAAVTVLGLWLAYFPLRAVVSGGSGETGASWTAVVSVVLAVAVSWVAQLRAGQRLPGPQAATGGHR